MREAKLLTLFIILLGFFTAGSWARAADKAVMADFQKLLQVEEEMHSKLDGKLLDTLKDLQNVKLTSMTGDVLDTTLMRHEGKVTESKEIMVENHLRIEFLNEFVSALEKAGDARRDTPTILLDLAHRQLLGNMESGQDSKLWLFEMDLSIAVRDIMEPSENLAEFVKQYMIYSSLRDPRTPSDFLKTRDYMGGNPHGAQKVSEAQRTSDTQKAALPAPTN